MEQLSFFNLISVEGDYTVEKRPSGITYYRCAKCNKIVRIDLDARHARNGDDTTIHKHDICECGAVMKW